MSVPKKRRTSSSVGRRRSHHALKSVNLSKCPQCEEKVLPHTACAFCGTYKKNTVIRLKEKKVKSE